GLERERLAVAGVLPRVRRDLVSAADAAGGDDDRLGLEDYKVSALAVVAERADAAGTVVRVCQERQRRVLHEKIDAAVDAVVLERADHLEAGAIADVREPRVAVAAEVPLQDPTILGAIEERAPHLQLANAVGRFLGVDLGHPPVVEVLAA